jgi:hypothetical protein
MSILNIAFNGKELFDWEGDNAAVASLDQEVRGMAKRGNTDPMVLWQSELLHIVKNDGRFFTPNPQVEMMIVIWGLLM